MSQCILLVALCAVFAAAVAVPVTVPPEAKPTQAHDPNLSLGRDNETYPFVSVNRWVQMMSSDVGVTVLDAREPPSDFATQAGLSIPGSKRARWTDFTDASGSKTARGHGAGVQRGWRRHGSPCGGVWWMG